MQSSDCVTCPLHWALTATWLDCSEEEAAQAYDIAAIQHRGSKVSAPDLMNCCPLNGCMPVECYSHTHVSSLLATMKVLPCRQAVTNFSTALYEDASVLRKWYQCLSRRRWTIAEDFKARCTSAGSTSGKRLRYHYHASLNAIFALEPMCWS